MEINVINVMTAVCGTVISAALVAMARSLNSLIVQVATLNTQVSQIRQDLDFIKGSYVQTQNFRERMDRVDGDLNGLGKKVGKLYDEHISCPVCHSRQALRTPSSDV
jgi:uncharacterized protein (DUF3084 family)